MRRGRRCCSGDPGSDDRLEYVTGRNLSLPQGMTSQHRSAFGYFYAMRARHDISDSQLSRMGVLDLNQLSSLDMYLLIQDTGPVYLTFPDGSSFAAPSFVEIDFAVSSMSLVPEPSGLALAALGFMGLAAWRCQRRKRGRVDEVQHRCRIAAKSGRMHVRFALRLPAFLQVCGPNQWRVRPPS